MEAMFKDVAVIFDLDDLLFKEFDFVRSGFWTISRLISDDPKPVFKQMMSEYFSGRGALNWACDHQVSTSYTLEDLLGIYRSHMPDISLSAEAVALLEKLKKNNWKLGLITDGRSQTQRNKIEALKLGRWISEVIISEEFGFEKPSLRPYQYFMELFHADQYIYIADNVNKDFIAPRQLGWWTIALADNGLNVHTAARSLSADYCPDETIQNLSELLVRDEPCLLLSKQR